MCVVDTDHLVSFSLSFRFSDLNKCNFLRNGFPKITGIVTFYLPTRASPVLVVYYLLTIS